MIYFIFTKIGNYLIGDNFSADILLSLVVLPSILILKRCGEILAPYTVSVSLSDNTISVKHGFLTTFEDSLNLRTVENIEVVTSVFGKVLDYATLRVYTYGSWVEIPNVKSPSKLKERIELISAP